MRRFRRVFACVVVAATISRSAHANDKTDAGRLLAEGRHLMAAQSFDAACAKIAESQTRFPTAGTALTLATCYEKSGKFALAWTAYKAAAGTGSSAQGAQVIGVAQRSMTRLESKVSRLTLHLTEGARVSGLDVRVDNESVPDSDFETPVIRNAGGHDIQASAPGRKTWEKRVDLKPGAQGISVDVPRLESDGPANKEAPSATPAEDAAANANATDRVGHPGQAQRIVGIAVAGAGLAGIGLGVFSGISANAATDDLKAACGTGARCVAANGQSLHDSATAWAGLADISFIAGGAALAAGVVVFLTAPKDPSASVSVGLSPALRGTGLSVVGRF